MSLPPRVISVLPPKEGGVVNDFSSQLFSVWKWSWGEQMNGWDNYDVQMMLVHSDIWIESSDSACFGEQKYYDRNYNWNTNFSIFLLLSCKWLQNTIKRQNHFWSSKCTFPVTVLPLSESNSQNYHGRCSKAHLASAQNPHLSTSWECGHYTWWNTDQRPALSAGETQTYQHGAVPSAVWAALALRSTLMETEVNYH